MEINLNTVLVHTQFKENYGAHDWDGTGQCPQYWKPKGRVTFKIQMDADTLLYSNAEAVFSKMVAAQSNDYEAFEFVEYEIQWEVPLVLGTEDDYMRVSQEVDEQVEEQVGQ